METRFQFQAHWLFSLWGGRWEEGGVFAMAPPPSLPSSRAEVACSAFPGTCCSDGEGRRRWDVLPEEQSVLGHRHHPLLWLLHGKGSGPRARPCEGTECYLEPQDPHLRHGEVAQAQSRLSSALSQGTRPGKKTQAHLSARAFRLCWDLEKPAAHAFPIWRQGILPTPWLGV